MSLLFGVVFASSKNKQQGSSSLSTNAFQPTHKKINPMLAEGVSVL
jgi:hypothetical protein